MGNELSTLILSTKFTKLREYNIGSSTCVNMYMLLLMLSSTSKDALQLLQHTDNAVIANIVLEYFTRIYMEQSIIQHVLRK